MSRPRQEPNPANASLEALKLAGKCGSYETATRCTAIQLLIIGVDRDQVCEGLCISESSLRKWIRLFNQRGIDGLIVAKRPGRPAKIKGKQADKLVEDIEHPEVAEREFWTARAFHGHIQDVYQIECSYQTVVRFFHKQGYALKVPQPWPDRQDEKLRDAFRQKLKELCANEQVDLWFGDESGFEGDPRPRRRWDKKGRKTRVTKNGDHVRMNVIGMVCPRDGQFFAIEASHVDSQMFQAFLDEANKCVKTSRKTNFLILDNASWHKKKTLEWGAFQPLFLPPYSPDLNPIERIWLTMKARWFNNHVCKNRQALMKRLDTAILDVIDKPDQVKSTASTTKLF